VDKTLRFPDSPLAGKNQAMAESILRKFYDRPPVIERAISDWLIPICDC
jgi:hypothetical protein